MIFLAVEATMDVSRPRRLNFNAPLLSTKRHAGEEKSSAATSKEISNRIPFSWEEVPGTPKILSMLKGGNINQEETETPRLKLPPGRLPVPPPKSKDGQVHNHDDNFNPEAETPRLEIQVGTLLSQNAKRQVYDHVNGHHAKLDDDDGDDESYGTNHELPMPPQKPNDHDITRGISREVFSDAVDVLSLTQAIDIVEHQKSHSKSFGSDHSDSNGNLTMESVEHSGSLSPSYIIQRFLPDAAALAASSALAVSAKKLNKNKPPYFHNHPDNSNTARVSRAVGQSCSSPKGCGLQMLLPWRTKQRICGLKNPVMQGSPLVLQPKCSPKVNK